MLLYLICLDLKELLRRVANMEQEVKSLREFRTNSSSVQAPCGN